MTHPIILARTIASKGIVQTPQRCPCCNAEHYSATCPLCPPVEERRS